MSANGVDSAVAPEVDRKRRKYGTYIEVTHLGRLGNHCVKNVFKNIGKNRKYWQEATRKGRAGSYFIQKISP